MTKLRGNMQAQTIKCGDIQIQVSPQPLTFKIAAANGETIQQLTVNEDGVVLFQTGDSPLLGLGEGGRNSTAVVQPIA
jgi:hypothetical protein